MKKCYFNMMEGISFGFFLIYFTGCACVSYNQGSNNNGQYNAKQYLVEKPNQRLINPDKYFRNEQETINKRRKVNGLHEHYPQIGLAFSGGGIRSNAFQLGLLSGLHEIEFLKKVDYISAVSGGSWAAGAYKVSKKNDKDFFKDLDQIVLQDNMQKTNDPRMRPIFNSYEEALHEISEDWWDILRLHVGYGTQEEWREMLKKNVLNDIDVPIQGLDVDGQRLRSARPFIIFNATHDATFLPLTHQDVDISENLPFEITSNFYGTIADCGNTCFCLSGDLPDCDKTCYCSLWDRLWNKCFMGIFTSTTYPEVFTPLSLSYAMAISSAVIPPRIVFLKPNLLQWKLPIPTTDDEKKLHRVEMVLTDGGHSENLGALALMERKVPRIIISDIAHDPGNSDEDLKVLKNHAEKLFGMKIDLYPDPTKQKKEGEEGSLEIFKYQYSRINNDAVIGTILYVKPRFYETNNGFKRYLLKVNQRHFLKTYLDTTLALGKIKFPTDKTFATTYEYKLIFCYYLLGRYFATEVMKPVLEKDLKWLIDDKKRKH